MPEFIEMMQAGVNHKSGLQPLRPRENQSLSVPKAESPSISVPSVSSVVNPFSSGLAALCLCASVVPPFYLCYLVVQLRPFG